MSKPAVGLSDVVYLLTISNFDKLAAGGIAMVTRMVKDVNDNFAIGSNLDVLLPLGVVVVGLMVLGRMDNGDGIRIV